MVTATIPHAIAPTPSELSDEEVVQRVLAGDTAMFEILMRRHNQSVYRAARAVLRDDAEAEDVMHDAYVRAYQNLAQFEGRARFSTWLIRIAVHEALARRRRRSRWTEFDDRSTPVMTRPGPEDEAARGEVRRLLEDAVESLPSSLRTVLVLRSIEELSTAETAQVLGLTEDNVKIRLHRARAQVRKRLLRTAGEEAQRLFVFEAPRCDRVVRAVMASIGGLSQ